MLFHGNLPDGVLATGIGVGLVNSGVWLYDHDG